MIYCLPWVFRQENSTLPLTLHECTHPTTCLSPTRNTVLLFELGKVLWSSTLSLEGTHFNYAVISNDLTDSYPSSCRQRPMENVLSSM